jgi:ABC-2 type transport system permease protein
MIARILTIAQHEFLTLIRTKAFIAGILMLPLLMTAFITFMNYAEHQIDITERTVAVIDETGVLFDPLDRAARAHNLKSGTGDARTGSHILLVRADAAGPSVDDVAVALSARVKAKELFGFVELPAAILDAGGKASIRLYAQTTSTNDVADWLETAVNDEIARRRFTQAGVDQTLVEKLTTRADVSTFGLVERGPDGAAVPAREVDDLSRFGVPMFVLVLMFMSVMTGAMHLLSAVIEEKMSKISEVLLGAVTPVQLLAGKLSGVVAVSMLLTLVYLAGGVYALVSFGRPDLIDLRVMAWFLLFMVCGALMFGSIFLAIGSACSDLKDSQGMVQPATMLVLLAYLGSFIVMRAPESGLAVGLSLFPTMAPFAMMLRIVMPPGPPLWQVLLSLAILMSTTAGVVWAAGRIFRVGLLMQGKAPTLPELLKWVRL